MADDEDDISARTDLTKSDCGEAPSRSCTATPTPASRVPVEPLAAGDLSVRSETSVGVPRIPSVRFSTTEVPTIDDASDDDIASAVSAMDTEKEIPSEVSVQETMSGQLASKKSSTRTASQRIRQTPLLEKPQVGGENDITASALNLASDDQDSSLEEESDESSEESTNESEEDELSETEEDSSFEVASESSEDDIPLRKPSRRRSTATRQSPVKPRKSSVVPTPAIPEVLEEEEEEDVILPKSSRRSAHKGQGEQPERQKEGADPVSPRSPLNEIRVQDSVSPVKGMASLQLEETPEPLSPELKSRPEPVKKKKRLVERCRCVYLTAESDRHL